MRSLSANVRRAVLVVSPLLAFAACGGDDAPVTTHVEAALSPAARPTAATNCAQRVNNTPEKLLECVTLAGVRTHQAALQAIADANGGTRATGTPGYTASVEYVAAKLTAAGYDVTLDPFAFVYVPPSTLRQIAPVPATYETGRFTGSGSRTVTAAVTAVDVNLAPPRANTSGCEAADFAGFPPGNIALIQRGTCEFDVKVLNAQAAGASAVIIFNQGNTPDREGLIIGTLGDTVATIPVVGASFANGEALARPGSTAFVEVLPLQFSTQYNVIAESRRGDPSNVVMVGGHLDSIQAGPGIQDNGSGSAALLETALQMATVTPANKLRFAWWGGYESGLVGSTAYVAGLSDADRKRIALYIDVHMIASPNHVFFVLDGNGSEPAGPKGSAAIEKVFQDYYARRNLPWKSSPLNPGVTDLGPFSNVGIPVGGIFTGASGLKTNEEASLWGGIAGVAYDPCYRRACDTFGNVSLSALDINSDAVAHATLLFAMSTQTVNGRRPGAR